MQRGVDACYARGSTFGGGKKQIGLCLTGRLLNPDASESEFLFCEDNCLHTLRTRISSSDRTLRLHV